MKQTGVLSLGGVYVDINCPEFPFDDSGLAVETEVVGNAYQFEAGGSAVNFARLCASLELVPTFIGKVGDDAMGRMLDSLLKEAGVRPGFIVDARTATNISMNLVNDAGKSIMAVVGSANQALEITEVKDKILEQLPSAGYLYLGGCLKLKKLLPAFTEIVAQARTHGVKVVLDHGRIVNNVTGEEKNLVRELARGADYYLPSKDEFLELWEVGSIEEGLRLLQKEAAGVIIVKDGANGAATMLNGVIEKVPAYEVEPIHTVGAGDSFGAGFIAAQSEGQDILASIRFGCATAALKISQGLLPTTEAVKSLVKAR